MVFFRNNIPHKIKPLIFIFGVLSILYGSDPNPSTKSFLFCLKSDVTPLSIDRSNDSFSVDNTLLNRFFKDNNIINIEKWIPNATDLDRDGDIYLNRIYRAYTLEDDRGNITSIIDKMQNLSVIKYSEYEYLRKPLYTPNDPLVELQCSLNSIKTKQAWDYWDIENGNIPNAQNVLLASVDTGVDYTHPDIQSNSWINQGEIPEWMFEAGLDLNNDSFIIADEVIAFLENEGMDVNNDGQIDLRDSVSDGSPFEDFEDNDGNGYDDDLLGWDCSGQYGPDDNDPFPKEGVAPNGTWAHGTHVAGILAATTDNDLGMASTAYNAKYISVKVSRENQTGEPGISDGYAGITYAAKAGYFSGSFAIINNSWGGGGYSASENSVINNAQNTYGAIILSSAGNGYDSGGEQYGTGYPGSYDNCISVAAIGCSYAWGNWATYHPTVDLSAPGESIQSAIIGSGYESWDGSSMACPNAASAIGLLSAYHPNWNNIQLRQRIEESADRRIYEVNPDYETCNGNSGVDCLGKGMVDIYKAIGMDFSPNLEIESAILTSIGDNDSSTNIDNDEVLNPGESAYLQIELINENGWADANAVIASLTTDNSEVIITDNSEVYGNIDSGNIAIGEFAFTVPFSNGLNNIEFYLNVQANGVSGYQYSTSLLIEVEVTLFQEGFPFDTNTEVKSSPTVEDLDNDGDNEIVFADKFGNIRIIQDGQELENDTFPYDAGNEIWGSIASADLDLDGMIDFVVSSKNGHLYIFDINGLKVDYFADRWLIATPVIGNIDDDEELEVIIGGYQSPTSSSPLFAINHDGSNVQSFPYILGEKLKAGVAVADMNDNGKDDMVFGTDGDNLYVLLDNLTVASGFPIDLGNNLRSEPAILFDGDEKIILIGCNDNNFYGVNYSDASIRFIIPTGDDVYTSAAFKDGENGTEIYFGSDDGNVYGIDINGNNLPGFPVYIGGVLDAGVVGSIVFGDLDDDDNLDLIAVNNKGEIYAFNESLDLLEFFPIYYPEAFSSAPMVIDYDLDGDMEIVSGSGGDLVMIDYKYNISNHLDSWSVFKGDFRRSGFYDADGGEEGCSNAQSGDVNCDSIINILDIVTVVNMVVNSISGYSEYEIWAADINQDGVINVLDIVVLVNIVVND